MQAIGNTPLIKSDRLTEPGWAMIYVKFERFSKKRFRASVPSRLNRCMYDPFREARSPGLKGWKASVPGKKLLR
jgi:hypothetical protein